MRNSLDGDNRPVRCTVMVAQILAAYNVNVAVRSETRLSGEGSMVEVGQGYIFYWREVPEGQARVHGVAFAMKSDLVKLLRELPIGHSERLMSIRVPLAWSHHITIISADDPTLNVDWDVKDEFYCALTRLLQGVRREGKLVNMDDFNTRVGKDAEFRGGIIGAHGTGNMNSNGLTKFQMKYIYNNTWRHPDSGHWHMIDQKITRIRGFKECLLTCVMRGANCGSDHQMQCITLLATVGPPVQKTAIKSRNFNTVILLTERRVEHLGSSISAAVQNL